MKLCAKLAPLLIKSKKYKILKVPNVPAPFLRIALVQNSYFRLNEYIGTDLLLKNDSSLNEMSTTKTDKLCKLLNAYRR